MKRTGKNGPVRIGKLVGSVLKRAEGKVRRPEALAVVALWPEIVGGNLVRTTRAVKLSHGKLFVEVKSPAWKQELLPQRRNIIRRINKKMGKDVVADMVINVRDFINVE